MTSFVLALMTHWIMGTLWEIETPHTASQGTIDQAFAEIRRVDALLSHYRDETPVSRLNRDGSQVWPMEAIALLERCLDYSTVSLGAFDVTVAPLVTLWGFKDQVFHLPSPEAIQSAKQLTGSHRIRVEGDRVVVETGTQLEFGAVGKGYALDRAREILSQAGIRRARLNAGGQQAVIGRWRMGIRHPRQDGLLGEIEVENASVSTSGDYERGFVHQGRRYSHILDPRSGWPVVGYPSVTVVASSAEHADMLSTVGAILGPGAIPLMERYSATAVWYQDDGRIVAMANFPWAGGSVSN